MLATSITTPAPIIYISIRLVVS